MLLLLAAGIAAVALSHIAPFPFLLDRFAPAGSIWRMPATEPPAVYFTFDDGPNPAATPALLDVLRAHRARATFFVIPEHVTPETAPILARMVSEGHAIALHSATRALLLQDPDTIAATLDAGARRIAHAAGVPPCRLFRPHAGWRSGRLYAGLARAGYTLAGWSWGLWDWDWFRRPDGPSLARRLLRRISPGDIVVMHDGHHRNPRADRRYAVEAMAILLPALAARGFRFEPLCEPPPARGGATHQGVEDPPGTPAGSAHIFVGDEGPAAGWRLRPPVTRVSPADNRLVVGRGQPSSTGASQVLFPNSLPRERDDSGARSAGSSRYTAPVDGGDESPARASTVRMASPSSDSTASNSSASARTASWLLSRMARARA